MLATPVTKNTLIVENVIGNTTYQNSSNGVAPSILAASVSDGSMESILLVYISTDVPKDTNMS